MKKPSFNSHKSKEFRHRSLTVSHKSYERSYHRLVFFPEIRIAGKWVQECGFEAGDRVAVTVSRNRIILKRVSNDQH